MIKPGDTLPNGWTAIAASYNVVLAMMPGKKHQPYATWQYNSPKETYWGHYFKDFSKAAADFLSRVKANRPYLSESEFKADLDEVADSLGIK